MRPDPLNVLLVDDTEAIRESLKAGLARAGCLVHTAIDGQDAWAQLQRQPFDLLITDLQMPNMNGLELLALARQRYPALRSIAMFGGRDYFSVASKRQAGADARKTGADRALVKPFRLPELLSAVDALFNGEAGSA